MRLAMFGYTPGANFFSLPDATERALQTCSAHCAPQTAINVIKGIVTGIVSPQTFMTLGVYIGQAVLCTPENPNCDVNPAVEVSFVAFLLYQLAQFVATVTFAN